MTEWLKTSPFFLTGVRRKKWSGEMIKGKRRWQVVSELSYLLAISGKQAWYVRIYGKACA